MDVVGVRKNNSWLVEFVEDFIFEDVFGALRGRRINISYIFWESQKSGEFTLDRTSQWHIPNRIGSLPTSKCRAKWWRSCQGVKETLSSPSWPVNWMFNLCRMFFQAASTSSSWGCSRFYSWSFYCLFLHVSEKLDWLSEFPQKFHEVSVNW